MQEVVAVDIGNSAIKLAVRQDAPVIRIDFAAPETERAGKLSAATADLDGSRKWLVCSVDRETSLWLENWVTTNRINDQFRNIEAGDIALQSNVEEREALGRDRLLASWYAATQVETGVPAIVIDAGTAVTIDVVNANRQHVGGLIFPGPHTCLSAVSSQTDALPNLAKQPTPDLSTKLQLGLATEPAILLGVHQLQLFGIIAMVSSLELQYPEAKVFCCGGELQPVRNLLPEHWDHRKDFLTDAVFSLKSSL